MKLSGSYELPYDIMISAFLNARSGFPVGFFRWGSAPADVPGRDPSVLTEPFGDSRYEKMVILDWRVEKSFELPYGRIGVIFDMFNTFNTNTVLQIQRRENAGNFGNVFDYISPRVFRLGFRYRF